MSNPDAFLNSQVPTPDTPTVPDEPVFPTDAEQPETQGEEPLEAELGEDGEGDLAPGDVTSTASGDAPTDLRDSVE